MEGDLYKCAGGSLKLKLKGGKETKKKKKKLEKKFEEALERTKAEEKKRISDQRTAAQQAFDAVQEQRQMERTLKKASKSHKERVQDLNSHLDCLTEHFDIPKVSWTK